MKTLKLFNAVISKENVITEPFVSEENGFIIEPNARWAQTSIIDYYKKEQLNGNDLNKTFHKSWKKIKDTPRCELLIHQILHYITTYGSNFQAEIYIPDEVLRIPSIAPTIKDLPSLKLKFKVIKGYKRRIHRKVS